MIDAVRPAYRPHTHVPINFGSDKLGNKRHDQLDLSAFEQAGAVRVKRDSHRKVQKAKARTPVCVATGQESSA